MKRLTPYKKRQRAGQREWTRFQKYRHHYQHLSTLFSGFALGGGFVLLMGLARGYNTPIEIVAAFGLLTFVGIALSFREYFSIKSSWRYWVLAKK